MLQMLYTRCIEHIRTPTGRWPRPREDMTKKSFVRALSPAQHQHDIENDTVDKGDDQQYDCVELEADPADVQGLCRGS